ncbi:MAG: fructose-6-phosphate aldolase [Candidatus Thermoplasmatota archaeon]|nr:fructose-6-phosphate aldolase [Candidatus Thermoplasmatota archaeon]
MKFFLDTASIKEIKEGIELSMVDGVTTNPTLLSKETGDPIEILKSISKIVKGPVSAEVISTDVEDMVKEGKKLADISENINIKIPVTFNGLKATRILHEKNIKVNMTLIFSPSQALLAAKAGASFVSPFVGRIDDISGYGMDLVEQIMTIYKNYNFQTEIIVASIRNPVHVVEAALTGAHIATMPFNIMHLLVKHPLTDIGIERFLNDWNKIYRGNTDIS